MRSRARVLAALLAGALLAACSASDADLRRYTDPDERTLFAVPPEWNLYEFGEMAALDPLPFTAPVQGLTFAPISSVGFDGGPLHDPANLQTDLLEATYPIGASVVRRIGPAERDFLSRFTLTQSVIPYRSLTNAQEITKEDFTFGNGFDGVRVLVSYTDATGQQVGVAYMISVTDDDEELMYSMVAGCSFECYRDNRDSIEGVVDSWLVNTRD